MRTAWLWTLYSKETDLMRYENTRAAVFVSRPNRFTAIVAIDGNIETVHVKNTGRCRELLFHGADVMLQLSDNPGRKTRYDLISVRKDNLGWVNIDSQATNKVMGEWLQAQDFTLIRPEYTYGDSRIDFYMEKGNERYLMEVKGCTLEIDGIGYFPDAPTERGIKHLKELAKSVEKGYHAIIAFVIQMNGMTEVRPNIRAHTEFGTALEDARQAGVEVLFLPCRVTQDTLEYVG